MRALTVAIAAICHLWPTARVDAQEVSESRIREAVDRALEPIQLGLEVFNGSKPHAPKDPANANRLSDCLTYYQCSGAPLKNAAAKGHLEIVKLLLSAGADPNLQEEGIAPHGHALYAAAANRHFEIAQLLLEHGAYPNPEVESSADALSRAISNDDRPMIVAALRTLEAEAGGVAAVIAAVRDGLGDTFIAAAELIRGAEGRVIGMKTFGASAPLKELQRKFGFEPERVVSAAMELLGRP